MSLDIESILKDWPHEPGQLKVRKILGNDGEEKIQLRLDLGVIQMNAFHRPDGQRPYGYESLLEYFRSLAKEAEEANDDTFRLNAEQCSELQQEAIQYHHRYISLFQLNDFQGVIRDTSRNLEMITFVSEHAESKDISDSLEQFRPYVLMMNTRARASMELARADTAAAIKQIEAGCARIREVLRAKSNSDPDQSQEIIFLSDWLRELKEQEPIGEIEKLTRAMKDAIAEEAYERAAELRDQIREAQTKVTQ